MTGQRNRGRCASLAKAPLAASAAAANAAARLNAEEP
jgi:hypothetical protein